MPVNRVRNVIPSFPLSRGEHTLCVRCVLYLSNRSSMRTGLSRYNVTFLAFLLEENLLPCLREEHKVAIDVCRARRETPGCQAVLHLNNAGAALMPQPVLHAVVGHVQREALLGGYEAAEQAHAAVEHVYDATATLLGCQRDEIAFVESATRAWDMAFYAVPLGPGDRILTAMAEYASNYLAFLQVARQTCVLYLLDACQSVGQMPLNVEAIGCDMLSTTGRKYLRGPRGTGLLYVRRSVLERLEPPFVDLHAAEWVSRDRLVLRPDARRFENWEANYAGKIGLGVAIDYALSRGLDHIWTRIAALASRLRERLNALPGVTVRDPGAERCGIVSFTVNGHDADEIRQTLARQHINVTVSRLTSTRLDMEARSLTNVVRASVHYYNSEAEIDRFCTTLATLR